MQRCLRAAYIGEDRDEAREKECIDALMKEVGDRELLDLMAPNPGSVEECYFIGKIRVIKFYNPGPVEPYPYWIHCFDCMFEAEE